MQGAAVAGAAVLTGAAVLAALTLRRIEVREQTCRTPDEPRNLSASGV
jgi:DHA2 family multidrug resistance protein-like MFS transporter